MELKIVTIAKSDILPIVKNKSVKYNDAIVLMTELHNAFNRDVAKGTIQQNELIVLDNVEHKEFITALETCKSFEGFKDVKNQICYTLNRAFFRDTLNFALPNRSKQEYFKCSKNGYIVSFCEDNKLSLS